MCNKTNQNAGMSGYVLIQKKTLSVHVKCYVCLQCFPDQIELNKITGVVKKPSAESFSLVDHKNNPKNWMPLDANSSNSHGLLN